MKWREINHYQRVAELKRLYALGYRDQDVAAELECSCSAIESFRRKNKIIGRSQGAQPGNKSAMVDGLGHNTIKRLAQRVVTKDGRLLHVCERCRRISLREVFGVHHRDRDISNNDPTNLEVLCQSCHSKEHNLDRPRNEEGRFVSES